MPGRIFMLFILVGIVCLSGYFILIFRQTPSDSYQNFTDSLDAGLIYRDERAFDGYTVLTAVNLNQTYLIDHGGYLVHEWKAGEPGFSASVLPNGNLLRTAILENRNDTPFHSGGETGKVQMLSWDGELVWDYTYSNAEHLLHHDVEPLPNGNFLMTAWERKTADEAIQAGRDPAMQGGNDVWVDYLIEVKPTGKHTGEIVWEWHVWDHLVQNHNPAMPNFGVVAENPNRVDINYFKTEKSSTPQEREALHSLGYLSGGSSVRNRFADPDWTHINSISYNPERGLIALSVREFDEIWVIEHHPESIQNESGGGIVFRWGNPDAYDNGSVDEQQLFAQHDVQWIADGLEGEGNLLVFNNGKGRLDGEYSSVLEIAFPNNVMSSNSNIPQKQMPVWSFTVPEKTEFYVPFLSGAQRLPNGNTLICDGMYGMVFEVTRDGEMVWQYKMPIEDNHFAASPDAWYRVGIFTARKYGKDYPGFDGNVLEPSELLSERFEGFDS